jgi:hypothetical protein
LADLRASDLAHWRRSNKRLPHSLGRLRDFVRLDPPTLSPPILLPMPVIQT